MRAIPPLFLLAVMLLSSSAANAYDFSRNEDFLVDLVQSGAKARLSTARPASVPRRSMHSACLKAVTMCDPSQEIPDYFLYSADSAPDQTTDVACCDHERSLKDEDFIIHPAPAATIGQCWVDTDDVSNLICKDTPFWAKNFNAYCSLRAADQCEQGPLCDGVELAATGPVFKVQAYSTSNPTPLPVMDNCRSTGTKRRSNTTASDLGARHGTESNNLKVVNNKKRAVHASVGQQKVWLGYAHLFSGMMQMDNRVQEMPYMRGWFEYVAPIRSCYGEGVETKCDYLLPEPPIPLCQCYQGTTVVGNPGWEEVDISEVPEGAILVDGRIHTFNLKFY